MAGIQLYSDKTVLNFKNRQSHPIRATLLNISYPVRIKNLNEVGYLPVEDRPSNMTLATWKKVKQVMYSRCIATLLQPLKDASHAGLSLKDPSGVMQHVYPRLLNYCFDDPESKMVMCIKGGNTQYPCELCKVPHDKLHLIGAVFEPRTEAHQKEVYKVSYFPLWFMYSW